MKDARHYRLVYRDAVTLAPDLSGAITEDADYPELLFDNVEEMLKYVTLQYISKRYHNDHVVALEMLQRVYDLLPTFGV